MPRIAFVMCILAALPAVVAGAERADAPPATISVDEISPGMRGYGYTAVSGTRPERFEVEVLGVIRKMSPGRDAIIVKTSGLSLERSGIFGGMSGSPVYVDGRLAGAVAFGWGWPKDAVGGVTPIAEMEKGAEERAAAPPAAGPGPQFDLSGFLTGDPGTVPTVPPVATRSESTAPPGGPITLATSALSPEARAVASAAFPTARFVLAEGAVGAAPVEAVGPGDPLEPGSNLFAALVTGDMFLGAVGTVTDLRGKEVYAFGHPFLDLEGVRIPMYTAGAITVFASTYRSFRIAYPIEEVGAITRDFATGVYGTIGAESDTFPVTVAVTRDGRTRRLRYRLFRHFAVTPQLVATVAAESAVTYGELSPHTTLSYTLDLDFEGAARMKAARAVAGADAVQRMAGVLAAVLSATMYNPIENLTPEGLILEMAVEPGDRSAEIESAFVPRNVVEAGGKLELFVRLRPTLAKPVTLALEVAVPETTPAGTLSLMICDGRTSDRIDLLEARNRLKPATIEGLLEALTPRRGPRRLVARLAAAHLGVVRDQREFPNLPSSTLAILAAPQETAVSPLYRSVVGETETEYVLSGRKIVPIVVKAPPQED
jgi:hypothetical protein